MLLSESCGLVFVGRPLQQEDGSAICSAITQWSESSTTHNHTLLSHLRLSQPGGPGSHTLQLAGLGWRYSNPPPIWRARSPYTYPSGTRWYSPMSKSHYDQQSISMSWCLIHMALEGFHLNEFQSDIKRWTLRRNFLCYHWEGCM
jgi:hypothetical protein